MACCDDHQLRRRYARGDEVLAVAHLRVFQQYLRKADTSDCAVYVAIGRLARLKGCPGKDRSAAKTDIPCDYATAYAIAGTTFRGRIVIAETVQG
jgi:hypothetical protein